MRQTADGQVWIRLWLWNASQEGRRICTKALSRWQAAGFYLWQNRFVHLASCHEACLGCLQSSQPSDLRSSSLLQPHLSQLQSYFSQLQPYLAQLQPHLAQLQPHLAQLQPHLAQLQPHLAQLQCVRSITLRDLQKSKNSDPLQRYLWRVPLLTWNFGKFSKSEFYTNIKKFPSPNSTQDYRDKASQLGYEMGLLLHLTALSFNHPIDPN